MLILITIKNAMTAIINRLNFLQLTTFGAGFFYLVLVPVMHKNFPEKNLRH